MTVKEFADKNDMVLACGDGGREITSVYCCDLLSIVMGRAPADCAWITVMGNLNAIAVAVLADVSCILLAENMPLDKEAQERATIEEVTVIRSRLPVYETARLLDEVTE